MGQNLISFKSDVGWRGKSWSSTADRGERQFIKIENGYVHAGGSEIRAMPGMVTLLDLSEENNESGGYARYTIDAVRPIFDTTPNEVYQFGYYGGDDRQQTLYARAKPTHLHGFDQIGNELVFWGESRFREQPLYSSTRVQLNITHVGVIANQLVVDFDDDLAANSISDDSGPALNGASGANVYYFEGITVADPTFQATLDSLVNRKDFIASSVSTNRLTLVSALSNQSVTAVTGGEAHRVRPRKFDLYVTGASPYAFGFEAIDDPDALTAWRVIDTLSYEATVVDCFPSWVANRRRDFGDQRDANDVEGVLLGSSTTRGRSRREGRSLPYRTNAEAAKDGIVLAAPQYGCLFWIPLGVPTNPDNWPQSPDNNQGGIPLPANSQFDQPRALGIPKAQAIECSIDTAQSSPSESGGDFSAEALVGSPELGFAAGTWKMAIAFEDSAMGWEGLASEPIEVEIPANNYAYALVIHYLHPGYIMPECLADRVNVYLAAPDEDALTYYASFPLSEHTGLALTAVNGTHWDKSSVYGFRPMSPETRAIYHRIQLPVIGDNSSIEEELEAEAERLAPQSAQMPRGSDAVRYVRGVLFSGGQVGNTGGALQLWLGYASAIFNPTTTFDDSNGLQIRVHGGDLSQPSLTQDGVTSNGSKMDWTTLGVAGRNFPSAYQGIEAISKTLFPGGPSSVQIDRVLNRRTNSLDDATSAARAHTQRLRLTRPIWDRVRVPGSPTSQPLAGVGDEDIYYRMFRGQLQVGDPGAPNRTNLTAIQFVDPNRGDDITAIGHLAGTAIICSQRETYGFNWSRNPASEVANLISNQHGCIAANSMVEFDGGLAWLSERGPCAISNAGGLQFIGQDIQEDFFGSERRYTFDSRGMMRHSWGCHDAARGLVIWGVRTVGDEATIEHQFETYSWSEASDELKSRFPCDEIVAWSYRTNAFSTWRLPLRIRWARTIRLGDGETVLAVLAEDGRLYGLLDAATDMLHPNSNGGIHILEPTATGTATATLPINVQCAQDGDATTGRNRGDQGTTLFLRTGMTVEGFFGEELRWTTTIASIESTGATGSVTLAAAQTWERATKGWTIRIGARPRLTIIPTYVGGENLRTTSVQGITMRYTLFGEGKAHAFCELLKTDLIDRDSAKVVNAAPAEEWDYLGKSASGEIAEGNDEYRKSDRRQILRGGSDSPEVSVRIVIAGDAQIRISDIALEVA